MDVEFSFSKRMLAVLVLALCVLLGAGFALGVLVGRASPAALEGPPLPAKPSINPDVKGK